MLTKTDGTARSFSRTTTESFSISPDRGYLPLLLTQSLVKIADGFVEFFFEFTSAIRVTGKLAYFSCRVATARSAAKASSRHAAVIAFFSASRAASGSTARKTPRLRNGALTTHGSATAGRTATGHAHTTTG